MDQGSVSCVDPGPHCRDWNIHGGKEGKGSRWSLAPLIPTSILLVGVQEARRQPRVGQPLHTQDVQLLDLAVNRVSILF
jgi:hypothetical protein